MEVTGVAVEEVVLRAVSRVGVAGWAGAAS